MPMKHWSGDQGLKAETSQLEYHFKSSPLQNIQQTKIKIITKRNSYHTSVDHIPLSITYFSIFIQQQDCSVTKTLKNSNAAFSPETKLFNGSYRPASKL